MIAGTGTLRSMYMLVLDEDLERSKISLLS